MVAPRSHRRTPSLCHNFLRTAPIKAVWSPFDLSRRDLSDDLLNIGFFHHARFSDGPRNNEIMNLKATFEILNRSPDDSLYQCFQNGVDVIEF
ncbi:hypothetical protein Y032_0004g1876 [Ancylostoma ceylanicum]|uniref:Uncharacterized protein n=1 Tax=Ancylostoma ceylanicum TaxID=53326 RepID=A0A016VU87_9BILA|nr:hypothetical protein Y032_0004g1876 [Ancylostoma ceylanicum]